MTREKTLAGLQRQNEAYVPVCSLRMILEYNEPVGKVASLETSLVMLPPILRCRSVTVILRHLSLCVDALSVRNLPESKENLLKAGSPHSVCKEAQDKLKLLPFFCTTALCSPSPTSGFCYLYAPLE